MSFIVAGIAKGAAAVAKIAKVSKLAKIASTAGKVAKVAGKVSQVTGALTTPSTDSGGKGRSGKNMQDFNKINFSSSPATYSPYKMKNSMLHKGAKHGAPVQMNYGSPAKGLYDNIKAGVSAAAEGAKYGLGAAEVTVDGGKGGKSTDQRNYDKKLEQKASQLYLKDRSSRTGGTDFSTVDEKTKNTYRAKAQNIKSKKS